MLTYFFSRNWKRSNVKIQNDFFHSNVLLCCVLLVHCNIFHCDECMLTSWNLSSYSCCPGQLVVSSVELLRRCSLHGNSFTTPIYSNWFKPFITIHKLRREKETKLFPEILVPFCLLFVQHLWSYIIKLSRHCIGLQLHPNEFIFQLICLICFSSDAFLLTPITASWLSLIAWSSASVFLSL